VGMRALLLLALLMGMVASAEAKNVEIGIHHAAATEAATEVAPEAAADNKAAPSDWKKCLPDGVSKTQVRAAVQAWLKKYPQYHDVSFSFLLGKLEAWLVKHPEMRDVAVIALMAKGRAWLVKHPKYRDIPAANLIAQDLAEGVPCQ